MLSLSTSVCAVPAPPQQLLDRFVVLRDDHQLGLATDPRLPLTVQRTLLGLATQRGLPITQIAQPLVTESRSVRSPSLASIDRYERRAAREMLQQLGHLAEQHAAEQVTLWPTTLELAPSIEQLARRFANGLPLDAALERLDSIRVHPAARALDSLMSTIDPLLSRAAAAGYDVVIGQPAIWPHHLPDDREREQLVDAFRGAPLRFDEFTDWRHAASVLGREPVEDERELTDGLGLMTMTAAGLLLPTIATPSADDMPDAEPETPPPSAARLADAAGLRLRLPLGSGEICWSETLERIDVERSVLTFDCDTSSVELSASLELLGKP